jgi:YD repeat-containing protein
MKWLLIGGVAVLSLTGYMACSFMKAQHADPVIKRNLVKWESTDAASSARLEKDPQGRISSLENNAEVNAFKFWADSTLLTEYSKTENRIVYEFKGKLDSAGKLMSGLAIASYSSWKPDTISHRFEYNAAGYLVKEFRDYGKAGTYTIVYEYEAGDAVKIYTWFNNELYNTKELEYYPQKDNLTGLEDFKFRRNVNNLTGNVSRHLVKKISSVARNGKLNYSFNYEYETDEAGLPLKLITKKGKKINSVTTYFYASKA